MERGAILGPRAGRPLALGLLAGAASLLPSCAPGRAVAEDVLTRFVDAVQQEDLDTLYCVNDDGSRNFIHTADVKGRFQTRKRWLWVLLIGFYLVMPWVEIGGKPAILIDIASRHFYLFGNTFNRTGTG